MRWLRVGWNFMWSLPVTDTSCFSVSGFFCDDLLLSAKVLRENDDCAAQKRRHYSGHPGSAAV